MKIEFGIGMFGDLSYSPETNQYQAADERLKQIIEQVKLADSLGIDVFAMGEHHREDYAVSAPEIILAALATVTENIKLSSGVSVVSSTDPVKLYQDFVMIDLISSGRTEIMAGRGSFIESFPLFGYELKDYNRLFEEKLELLLALNKTEKINWEGELRAPIVNQTIYPRPTKQLPVWIAVGGTPESVLRAARLGLPIIFAIIGGQYKQFRPLIDFYKEQYLKHGHDESQMQVAVHTHTFIADSKADIIKSYYPAYVRQMNKIGRERGWAGGYSLAQFEAGMDSGGALFVGEPDAVADKIIDLVQTFELTRFVAHLDNGGPKHEEIIRTIELYANRVLPQVKKHFNQ